MGEYMVALLSCSASVSALALLCMALTPLLAKRYSETGRYYAWLVLVVGLIVPFRPRFDHPIFRVDVPTEAMMPAIGVTSGAPVATVVQQAANGSSAIPTALAGVSWWQVVAAVWMVGTVAFLGYHAVKHWRFAKLAVRWHEDVADEQVLALFRDVKNEVGIARRIGLSRCACIGSPMMIGMLHPRILLPRVDLGRDELRYVLMHELIHHKRKDLWYKCLVLTATAMHWFNPVVHLMARAIGAQCESSCDAEVLRGADADARRCYCETIIGVVRRQPGLSTALSTNFYGGKKGMKKRIFSIMDMGSKRTGTVIVCCALLLTLGTGFAFAANAPQASVGATHVGPETAYSKADAYEKYRGFGLRYDPATDDLYYNGELVRYFEDWYPVDETMNAYVGTDHFDEDGTVDVHGVRDLSRIVHNADGSYDPSGVLVGVEPYSQAEFDAQDVDVLKNRSSYNHAIAAGSADEVRGGEAAVSNFTLEGDSKEAFKIYAGFGLTYDDDDVFRYHGKTVRRFADAGGATAFTRNVPNDYDQSVDLTAIRDADGKLTGLSVAGRQEFDERTERIEQTQREMEAFYKTHPNVTAYSAVETVNDEAVDDVSASSSAVVSEAAYTRAQTDIAVESTTENVVVQRATIGTGTSYDGAYATSVDTNYVDTDLEEYIGYGVSHDRLGRTWMFKGRPIAFLIDPGHRVYANFSEDNADSDFAERVESSGGAILRVVRTPDGAIDRIAEMSATEAARAIDRIAEMSAAEAVAAIADAFDTGH